MKESGMFLAKANYFGLARAQKEGKDAVEALKDRNDKLPIILVSGGGDIPDRNVISGTVAENLGIQAGKCYQVSWTLSEEQEFVDIKSGNKLRERRPRFEVWSEITDPLVIAALHETYGDSELIRIDRANLGKASKAELDEAKKQREGAAVNAGIEP